MTNSGLEIFIDGACQGNPGPSGIGVLMLENGKAVKSISRFIGNATNNIAEYSALICALEESLILGAKVVSIKTDSELLYRQIKKVYKVRNATLLGLYEQATRLLSAFSEVAIQHVPREQNDKADKLATGAIRHRRQ